jgi:hypothetical protein
MEKNVNNTTEPKHDAKLSVSGSTSNLENILGMLHEFRNWNREWDTYFLKHPKNVDEFAELLSRRYKVECI